jgi:hypothetical protein
VQALNIFRTEPHQLNMKIKDSRFICQKQSTSPFFAP